MCAGKDATSYTPPCRFATPRHHRLARYSPSHTEAGRQLVTNETLQNIIPLLESSKTTVSRDLIGDDELP
jgi:hypothetical protein